MKIPIYDSSTLCAIRVFAARCSFYQNLEKHTDMKKKKMKVNFLHT